MPYKLKTGVKMFKFLLLLLVSCPVMADEWTTSDTYREATYIAIDSMDWAQTREIAHDPKKYREQNGFLGDHPSVQRVDAYFVSAALVHYAIARMLPSDYRAGFQYVTIGIELGWVQHNAHMGIGMMF